MTFTVSFARLSVVILLCEGFICETIIQRASSCRSDAQL